jgi:hypothetical protein
MTANLLTLFIAMTLYFYLGSIHEEKGLVAEFGEPYVAYQKQVPRFLPRLRPCDPDDRPEYLTKQRRRRNEREQTTGPTSAL